MIKKNKSAYFIMPIIGYKIRGLKHYGDLFINSYLGDINTEINIRYYIILLFDNRIIYHSLYNDIKENPFYYKEYSPKHGYLSVVFKIENKEDIENIEKFKQGKYSKLSESLKEKITKGSPLIQNENKELLRLTEVKACYPKEEDRKLIEKRLDIKLEKDAEVLSIPNMDEELLDINKIDEQILQK